MKVHTYTYFLSLYGEDTSIIMWKTIASKMALALGRF